MSDHSSDLQLKRLKEGMGKNVTELNKAKEDIHKLENEMREAEQHMEEDKKKIAANKTQITLLERQIHDKETVHHLNMNKVEQLKHELETEAAKQPDKNASKPAHRSFL